MGQLAVDLMNPQNRTRIRAEGGQYVYGNPTHLIEDLIATRRAWQDEVTILADDRIHDRTFGYVAFWEGIDPAIDYTMPRQVTEDFPEAEDFFKTPEGRTRLLLFVEKEAVRLGNFDTRLNPEDRPSSWVRLLEDDSGFS